MKKKGTAKKYCANSRLKKNVAWVILTIVCLSAIVYATTTVVTEDSITTPEINDIIYISPTDNINTTINTYGANQRYVLRCGTYNLNSKINLVENIIIEGLGECSIINITGSSAYILGVNKANIIFRDFTIEGNNQSRSEDYLIYFNGVLSDNIRLENLHIKNVENRTIRFDGDNVYVQNNNFENVMNGLNFGGGSNKKNINILNNRITSNFNSSDPDEYGEAVDLDLSGANGTVKIINNYMSGFREETLDVSLTEITIAFNKIVMVENEAKDNVGITVNSGTNGDGNIFGNIITNVGDNGTAIKAPSTASTGSRFIKIYNNIIKGSRTVNSTGIEVSGIQHIKIHDNTFTNLYEGIFNNVGGGKNLSIFSNDFLNVTNPINNFYTTTVITKLRGLLDGDRILSKNITIGNVHNYDYYLFLDQAADGSIGFFLDSESTTNYPFRLDAQTSSSAFQINQEAATGTGVQVYKPTSSTGGRAFVADVRSNVTGFYAVKSGEGSGNVFESDNRGTGMDYSMVGNTADCSGGEYGFFRNSTGIYVCYNGAATKLNT